MDKTLLIIGSAIIGGVIGFFTGKYIYKNKYKKISDKEIEEVRNAYKGYFSNKKEKSTPNKSFETKSTLQESEPKQTRVDYSGRYRDESTNYRTASPVIDREEATTQPVLNEEEPPKKSGVYVMTQEEFDASRLNVKVLTLYKDGILADDWGEIIKDIQGEVGDALKTFGLYNDEEVYVHNDKNDYDYSIGRSNQTYYEAFNKDATLHPEDDI